MTNIQLYQLFQPTLVIVSLRVDPSKQRARVEARRSGFLAFLLHALGLGNQEVLAVSPAGFRKERSSFSGEQKVYCPRQHVSSSLYMMNKPVELLALAFMALAFGISLVAAGRAAEALRGIGFGLLGLAGLLVLLYFLSRKRVTVGFVTDAATVESLKLRVTGPELDELQDVVHLIEDLLRGDGAAEPSPPDRATPAATVDDDAAGRFAARPAPPGGAEVVACPHCQTRMQITAAHRGQQVRCPGCREVFQV